MLENEKFLIMCPLCQREVEYTLRQLQKGEVISCPHCGKKIQIEEQDSGSVEKLENQIKELVEKIPKKISVRE